MLLCDNAEICALAKKLGVLTKSMAELRQSCRTLAKETRDTFGNLEDDFGIQSPTRTPSTNNIAKDQREVSISVTVDQSSKSEVHQSHAQDQIKSSAPGSSSTEKTGSISSAKSSKPEMNVLDLEKPQSRVTSNGAEECNQPEQKIDDQLEALSTEHENDPDLHQPSMSTEKDVPIQKPLENDQKVAQRIAGFNTLDLEKEHSIAEWVRSLTNAAKSDELTGRDSPMSGHSSTVEATAAQPESGKVFKPLTYRQAVTGKADEVVKKQTPPPPKEILPSPRVSPVRDPSPPKLEDPEDSDEEIVVFNPKAKRLSAQKAQQTQRPQTPAASPKVSHARNVSGGRPHSRNGNQRQPRPGPPPVVIDPDSFGRGLPANSQPTVTRTFNPYGAHGRIVPNHRGNHRHHNPRPHMQITPPKANGVAWWLTLQQTGPPPQQSGSHPPVVLRLLNRLRNPKR